MPHFLAAERFLEQRREVLDGGLARRIAGSASCVTAMGLVPSNVMQGRRKREPCFSRAAGGWSTPAANAPAKAPSRDSARITCASLRELVPLTTARCPDRGRARLRRLSSIVRCRSYPGSRRRRRHERCHRPAASRASRSRISRKRLSILTAIPFSANCLCRRRARSSATGRHEYLHAPRPGRRPSPCRARRPPAPAAGGSAAGDRAAPPGRPGERPRCDAAADTPSLADRRRSRRAAPARIAPARKLRLERAPRASASDSSSSTSVPVRSACSATSR